MIVTLLAVGLYLPNGFGQQPGTVNIRPRMTTAQPGLPNVRVTVDRNRVPLGDEVTFTIVSPGIAGDPRFTVTIDFGDPSPPQKMGRVPVRHLYLDPGTYTYKVKIERPPLPSVKLIANPTTVATNSPVNFAAQLSGNYPNIQYRFVFADGSQTKWQDASQTSHPYAAAGRYSAFVDIGESSGGLTTQFGGSPRQAIQVTNPPPRTNTNTNLPPRGNTNANLPPRGNTNTNLPPRGNTNTNLPPRGNTHTNLPSRGNTNANLPPRGNTNANLPPRGNTNTTTPANTNNNTTTTTTTNTPPSPPCVGEGCDGSWPWWILLLLALLLILLAYQAATVFLLPRPQLVPNLDPGKSRVAPGKPLSIGFQLALDPNVTGGEYGLETGGKGLIKSERGSDG